MPWERKSYVTSEDSEIQAAAKAVFGTSTNYSGSRFVEGATGIQGWKSIPADWGGGDDGITAKPDVVAKITHPEKREYYTIVFDYFGTQVTDFTYYLSTTADIKKNLPKYGNSLEKMVRDNGRFIYHDDYQSHFYAQLNSELGGGLEFTEAEPETEYGMIVLVENSMGYKVIYTTATTGSIPTGTAEFEKFKGTYTRQTRRYCYRHLRYRRRRQPIRPRHPRSLVRHHYRYLSHRLNLHPLGLGLYNLRRAQAPRYIQPGNKVYRAVERQSGQCRRNVRFPIRQER